MKRSATIAAFCFAMLSGCGGKDDAGTGGAPGPGAVAPIAPSAVDPLAGAPEWRRQLTTNPRVVMNYGPGVGAITGAKMERAPEGYGKLTTTAQAGGWAGMRALEDQARTIPGAAIRLKVQVRKGAVQFLSTIDGAKSGRESAFENVGVGELREIFLPVDQGGPPLLIVANAAGDGPSQVDIHAIELVAPPVGGASPTGAAVLTNLPPWRSALTDKPKHIRNYSTAMGALSGAKLEAADEGNRIVTVKGNSAWAAELDLGKDGKTPGAVLHLRVHVEKGALLFVTFAEKAPQRQDNVEVKVDAGPTTDVWLPVAKGGAPLLVVADATIAGGSVGTVHSIELLAPPT